MDSSHFENNLKQTMNCPTTRAKMNEPGTQQGCGAGAEAILNGWSRGQKLLDGATGAWNLGSWFTEIVCWASELYE